MPDTIKVIDDYWKDSGDGEMVRYVTVALTFDGKTETYETGEYEEVDTGETREDEDDGHMIAVTETRPVIAERDQVFLQSLCDVPVDNDELRSFIRAYHSAYWLAEEETPSEIPAGHESLAGEEISL